MDRAAFYRSCHKILRLSGNDTFTALGRIIDQFNDPHLAIVQMGCTGGLKHNLIDDIPTTLSPTEKNVEVALKSGTYQNEYSLSQINVLLTANSRLLAYVDQSLDSSLYRGFQIIDAFKESERIYYGSWIDEFSKKRRVGRVEILNDTTFTTGAYAKWKRVFPKRELLSTNKSPLDINIRFLTDSTTLLEIPCSSADCKSILDSILAKNKRAILSRPQLIIDLRKNVGGRSNIIDSLIPFVYTNPISRHQTATYCTMADLEEAKKEYRKGVVESSLDDATAKEWVSWISLLRNSLGKFIIPEREVIRSFNTLSTPTNVDVIIDYSNQSAAELIILMLSQSKKVKTWGGRTHGAVDYLDYKPFDLGGRGFALYIPTGKRIISEYGVQLDRVGIYPDLKLEDGTDWVKIVTFKE